jgi:acetyltransferase-like isoleucine patch superfamily enzyme
MASLGGEFLDLGKLRSLGFGALGKDVLIHPTVIIIGLENLKIGDFSRIDAHSVIIANNLVSIGRNVHVGTGCYVAGGGTVELGDFSGLSQGVRLYSVTDDYTGRAMTNPTVADRFTATTKAPVVVGRHCIIGSGSVVLPGAVIGEGCAVGALSLVNRTLEPWWIYAGAPVRALRERNRNPLVLERQLLAGET